MICVETVRVHACYGSDKTLRHPRHKHSHASSLPDQVLCVCTVCVYYALSHAHTCASNMIDTYRPFGDRFHNAELLPFQGSFRFTHPFRKGEGVLWWRCV